MDYTIFDMVELVSLTMSVIERSISLGKELTDWFLGLDAKWRIIAIAGVLAMGIASGILVRNHREYEADKVARPPIPSSRAINSSQLPDCSRQNMTGSQSHQVQALGDGTIIQGDLNIVNSHVRIER